MTLIENMRQTDKFILYIYFYLFMIPWNFEKWQMGVLTVIMFIWWIIKYKGELVLKLKTILKFKPLVILIVFIIYTYISTLWSESISDGLAHVNKFHKYYFFIIPILFTSLNKENAKNTIKIIFFSFGTYAIFSLLIYLGFFVIEETGSNSSNPKGIMAYAIMSSFMAAGAICSFLIAFYEEKNNLKILFFIISLLCFMALLVNLGRTAQLSLILTITTLSLFYFSRQIFRLKFLIGIVFAILIVGLLVNEFVNLARYKTAYSEIINVVKNNKFDGSLGARIHFNKVGLEIISEYPFFGMGPEDNVKKLAELQRKDKQYIYPKIFTSFHSSHMDILTRYGLFGYFLILFSVGYLIYKLRHDKYIFSIACAYFLIVFYTSLANVMLTKKPFNYVFICIFVILSVYAYYMEKDNIDDKKTLSM